MTSSDAGAAARAVAERPGRMARVSRDDLTRVVAALVIVLIALRIELPLGLTAGTVLVLALTPVWLPAAWSYVAYPWVVILSLVSVISGVWLTEVASAGHAVSKAVLLEKTILLVGAVAGMGWILWSRRFLQPWLIASLFGVGLLLGIRPGVGRFVENPWRFGFSIPLTVLLLAVALRSGKRWLQWTLALALGVVSAANGGRSAFAILVLVAVFVLWQGRPTVEVRRASVMRLLLFTGVLVLAAYSVGQAVILDGYLGEETQMRTQSQVDASGSMLLGGRPEAAATAALILERPIGYGAGTIPSLGDIQVAKSGMAGINYDPNNRYVEQYMFAGRFELHSVLGDLWIWFGIPGAILAVAFVVVVVRRVSELVTARAASGIVLFLAAKTLWDVAFGPLYSAVPLLVLALGLLLVPRGTRARRAAVSPASEGVEVAAARGPQLRP